MIIMMKIILSKICYSIPVFYNPCFFELIFGIANQIGSEGMKYLSELLKSNNSIQTLELNSK